MQPTDMCSDKIIYGFPVNFKLQLPIHNKSTKVHNPRRYIIKESVDSLCRDGTDAPIT